MASSSSSSPAPARPSEHHHLQQYPHHLDHHPCSGGGGGSGTPAPPPPTPSNHNLSLTPAAADVALSRLLCQLTSPALSLPPHPSRLSSAGRAQQRRAPSPPVISLVEPQEALLRSAASEHGFFHLTDHGVPAHLPAAAQLECVSLLLTRPRDLSPLGFDSEPAGGGEDDDEDSPFLVFDMGAAAAAAAAADQGLPPAVWEYARHLERVGVEVVEMLSRAGGFRNPFQAEASTPTPRSLMWISSTAKGRDEGADGERVRDSDDGAGGPPPWGRCYPYAVCLQYEMRSWSRCLLLGDNDPVWTTVSPHADSVLVAIGDIAQVWSDGRFKKVRGRPGPAVHGGGEGSCVTLSFLVTLPPTDSVVSPLPPAGEGADSEDDGERGGRKAFAAFAFEEYAWRVFHEPFPLTDTLRRYRL